MALLRGVSLRRLFIMGSNMLNPFKGYRGTRGGSRCSHSNTPKRSLSYPQFAFSYLGFRIVLGVRNERER